MSIPNWNHEAGLNNVGSYQVSGRPFASGSINAATATKVEFPYVTRWVTIINNDASNPCKVGFSSAGVSGTNYFTVGKADAAGKGRSSVRLELKVGEIWLLDGEDVDVVAGLTTIQTRHVKTDAGNSWKGEDGVG
mgnify:FL=1